MINKKNLWFLTLFCLILVLSVYYVTMPSELLMTTNSDYTEEIPVSGEESASVIINESNILTALRIESEDATTEEKNNAYEKIKDINNKRTLEEKLEKQILETYNLKSFVKIDGDQIRVIVSSSAHDTTIANNIIRTIQSNYQENKYISVKFQTE